jgi:N-acetyl-anhydromuramyl-L-alanine amidase AmpD
MPVVLIQKPSPNFNDRPDAEVSSIVLHADAAPRIKQSIDWLRDPASKLSYHVIIGRLGDAYQLVGFGKRAWHAGVSEEDAPASGDHCGIGDCAVDERHNVNDFSIGLAFGNAQNGVEHFTEAQYQVGAEMCRDLIEAFQLITPERIVTHAHIALPAGRKADPGRFFDMPYFMGLVAK